MEIRVKIAKKLLSAFGKEELERILAEEINKRYLEYLKKEAKEYEKEILEGTGTGKPKGILSLKSMII